MSYIFISGIPATGKSYLAEKVAETCGMLHIKIDHWRNELRKDKNLKEWVDFFWNKNEKEYWERTSCDEQWENIVKQSEAIWPEILRKIKEIQKTRKSAIFEGVNILPHLASRDLNFSGIVLLGESFEKIFERNKKDPRWGKTEDLQRKEAEAFWNCERPHYQKEAKIYHFKTFTNPAEAEKALLLLIQFNK